MAPTEGQINVNTASWRALAAVPYIQGLRSSINNTGNSSVSNLLNCKQIAQQIVNYRNLYGPFKTLFDLNKVTGITVNYTSGNNINAAFSTIAQVPGVPNPSSYGPFDGDISPTSATTNQPRDGMLNDFEKRYNTLTRVSNLLTTLIGYIYGLCTGAGMGRSGYANTHASGPATCRFYCRSVDHELTGDQSQPEHTSDPNELISGLRTLINL